MAPPPSSAKRWTEFAEQLAISPQLGGVIWRHHGNTYDHPRHKHEAVELNLVVSGRGHYEVEGTPQALAPGTLLWIYPGQSHYVEERSSDFSMWIVALTPSLIQHASHAEASPLLHPGAIPSRRLSPEDFHWLEGEITRIYRSHSLNYQRTGLEHITVGAWEAFNSREALPCTQTVSELVYRAITELQGNLSITQDALAELLDTNPDVLGRLFRKEMGINFVSFRNRLRLRRFLSLARDPRYTLLSACLEAGFGSYAQFHRVFVNELGETPRAFLGAQGLNYPEQEQTPPCLMSAVPR